MGESLTRRAVELSNRQIVNVGIVDFANGRIEEMSIWSNRRILKWWRCRIVETSNGEVVESSSGRPTWNSGVTAGRIVEW